MIGPGPCILRGPPSAATSARLWPIFERADTRNGREYGVRWIYCGLGHSRDRKRTPAGTGNACRTGVSTQRQNWPKSSSVVGNVRRLVAVAAAVAAVVLDGRRAGERVPQVGLRAAEPGHAGLVRQLHVGGVERIGALDGLGAEALELDDARALVQLGIAAAGTGVGAGLDLGFGELAEAAW